MVEFPAEPPMPDQVRSLLIVGGTFDPPHRAHIDLAFDAARRIGCDHLLFIPAQRSPFKADDPASGEHRYAMLKRAIADRPNAHVSQAEIDRPPPSYTVDTLRRLRAALGSGVDLRLLIGSDHAIRFDRWREPDEILRLATPAVLLRPPHTKETLREAGLDERWIDWIVNTPLDPVKATDIRERIERGEDVSGLIDAAVFDYIQEHNLYSEAPSD